MRFRPFSHFAFASMCIALAFTLLTGCPPAKNPDDTSNPNPNATPATDGGINVSASAEAPKMDAVRAYSVGRTGYHLEISIEGSDANGDAAVAILRFLDDAGTELSMFDSDADGLNDYATLETSFDESVNGELSFMRTLSFKNYIRLYPDLKKIGISLRDLEGLTSSESVVSVEFQAVRSMDETCDDSFIESRCEVGLACKGTPTICQEGSAPNITNLAYLEDNATGGSRILVDGIEEEGDLATLKIEFLNEDEQPIQLDLDADGTVDSDFFVVEAIGSDYDEGTRFFVGLDQPAEFSQQVAKIAVTPGDAAGHEGTRVVENLRRTPTRGSGQSCDPRGYNACGNGTTCTPGVVGESNNCRSVASSQRQRCEDAPELDPANGIIRVSGEARGSSLWDPPTECASNDPKGLPDAVVRLHLAEDATRVRLSTAEPGTDFDTIVYVMSECSRTADAALLCGDDTPDGIFAALDFENGLPAGDYFIVIDSYDNAGGAYSVAVEVE